MFFIRTCFYQRYKNYLKDNKIKFVKAEENKMLIFNSYIKHCGTVSKNVDFIERIFTFWRNQRFRSKNGFATVLGLSRALFRSSWGALGRSEGPLDPPKRASRFILELSWA